MWRGTKSISTLLCKSFTSEGCSAIGVGITAKYCTDMDSVTFGKKSAAFVAVDENVKVFCMH